MKHFKGFLDFIREQGVIGLAVGFLLGGAVSKTVTSLVTDVINPIIGAIFGAAGNLAAATFTLGGATIAWGNFVSTTIDFVIIALVVYVGVRILGISKLDKK
jgi:large conductance mechanosensitive channel